MMEIYKKLEEEYNDLQEKERRLKSFIISDKYLSFRDESKNYLFLQLLAMGMYANCLKARMELITRENSKWVHKRE